MGEKDASKDELFKKAQKRMLEKPKGKKDAGTGKPAQRLPVSDQDRQNGSNTK